MGPHADLLEKITSKSAVLGFVGLGYVGLPVGLSFAAEGFSVRMHDVDRDRVDAVCRSELPFATSEPGLKELLEAVMVTGRVTASSDASVLDGCDVFFLAVDTPVTGGHALNTERLLLGVTKIGEHVRRGALVVVESTIAPGTMTGVVIPELERRSRLEAGDDFLVMHCPERLRPGRLLRNLRSLGRFVGADSEDTRAIGLALYRNVVFAPLTGVDYQTAEVLKTAENATRDVQIALANQLAIVCDVAGVDFRIVRGAVNQLWDGEPIVLEAGAGVGGHCLPKDPWLLVSGVGDGAASDLVRGARATNSYMPRHTANIAIAMLEQGERGPSSAVVAVLGVAYNAGSDDTRNSPGLAVAQELRSDGVDVRLHDPLVGEYAKPLAEVLRGADLAIVVTPHEAYRTMDVRRLRDVMRTPAVLDTRRALDAQIFHSVGIRYRALGVGALAE